MKRNMKLALSCAVVTWVGFSFAQMPVHAADAVYVTANAAQEEAKYESQQKQIITSKDIEQKQAKSAEDIVFNETGVSRTVDAMGRVGVSIRGADPRHTLIMVDGQAAMGDLAKYTGQADELMRIGTENLDRIEIVQGASSAKYGSDAIGGVINVITKKPTKNPGFIFNAESLRLAGDTGIAPHSNFYLRADSGKQGRTAFSIYGSKREVLPVYAAGERINKGLIADTLGNFEKNSLRFSGETSSIGVSGTVDIKKDNSLDFRLERYNDDLHRFIKHTNSFTEPSQQFNRNINRKTAAMTYNGKIGDATDYNVELNYTKLKEDDITLLNYEGKSAYKGTDIIKYIDNVDHQQYSLKLNANTLVNDKHLISYGAGMTRERGIGSRLKNAPKQTVVNVNPWDYSKNLEVMKKNDGTYEVKTQIHDYRLYKDKDGKPLWDSAYEWYGYDRRDGGKTENPAFSYADYYPLMEKGIKNYDYKNHMSPESYERYLAFGEQLKEENKDLYGKLIGDDERKKGNLIDSYFQNNPITIYGADNSSTREPVLFNGKPFKEVGKTLDNRISIGEAEIKKEYFYAEDQWQINDDNLFTPSIRIDHSNLFGTNFTFNLGLTHNVAHNANKRLKFNVGTGYSEPGMGELYYNWEMYSGIPIQGGFGGGIAKMGWYWEGNPNLKPEKSVNVDVSYEQDSKKDNFRATLFHNNINNYLSIYFTGGALDFYPELNESSQAGGAKYLYAPDLIYSFKNIGKAEITGVEAEWKHKLSDKWSTRLGYTYLHAMNKSDPTMPDRLLDKPKHKIDIGINYENIKSGWSGSLYGNYYVNLLDSNDLTGNGNIIESYQTPTGSVIKTSYENKTYKQKTYGLWNFIVQKKWGKEKMAYIAIDNVFNHRDDARALQARVVRFGVNFKFGPDGKIHQVVKNEKGQAIDLGPVTLDNYLATPFVAGEKEGWQVFGEYQVQQNWHDGSNRPNIKITENSFVGTAEKNLLDNNEKGYSQRLVLGANYRNDNTNIKVVGSLQSNGEMPTAIDVSNHKGLNHAKLDIADVTQKVNKWNFSVGKLTEKLGETGYYFNNNFVGARAVWTSNKTQVRIGYGDFRNSTGITDSAYTTVRYKHFMRPPTVDEFIGAFGRGWSTQSLQDYLNEHPEFKGILDANKNVAFTTQWNKAVADQDVAKQFEIVRRMHKLASEAYPNLFNKNGTVKKLKIDFPKEVFKYSRDVEKNGTVVLSREITESGDGDDNLNKYYNNHKDQIVPDASLSSLSQSSNATYLKEYAKLESEIPYTSTAPIEGDGSKFITSYLDKHIDEIRDAYKVVAGVYLNDDDFSDTKLRSWFYEEKPEYKPKEKGNFNKWYNSVGRDSSRYGYYDYDGYNDYGPKITDEEREAKFTEYKKQRFAEGRFINKKFIDLEDNNQTIRDKIISANIREIKADTSKGAAIPNSYFDAIVSAMHETEDGSPFPRFALGKATGVMLPAYGLVIDADNTPSLKRALYVDVKRELNPRLGVSAWYLASSQTGNYTAVTANEKEKNTVHEFSKLARVFGLGATYQVGYQSSISLDVGKNFTDFGKFMNGGTKYSYGEDNTDIKLIGKEKGKTPLFYTMRFNIGKADYNTPGSWSAMVDYKYFEHGAFFGGNGTDSLPDRYLDGIRSFTVGGAYVPTKNLLIEGFYTFGATSIGKRDTLFGPESFKLGNYSRVQMTYKF